MKNLQLNSKLKQAFTWLFSGLSVLFIVLLFTFKDTLNNFASKAIKAQAGSEIQSSESAFIDSAYNYSKNYPNRVNVVFINIMLPKNQTLMKYYGIGCHTNTSVVT